TRPPCAIRNVPRTTKANGGSAMSVEANTAKLQLLMDEVLTKHNLAVLDEIFHADYIEHEPPPGMGPGRDGLRQWLAGWVAAFRSGEHTSELQAHRPPLCRILLG